MIRARTFWGDTMVVTPPEELSVEIYLYGFYEEGLTRFMLDRVTTGMTVIDVGAHYGYFTLLAAHLVGPCGSVHAFEPTPSTAVILARNANGRRNVTVNKSAAWSSESHLALHVFGAQYSMFNSVFAPRLSLSADTKVTVPAISLDDYTGRSDLVPGFVKIDAESAESQVIEGLAGTLRQHHPALTVEVGDLSPDQPISSRELLDMISSEYDYRPFEYTDGQIRPHEPRDRYDYDNILLVPR
jgi:FkbM family methyltransferase